MKLPAAHIFSRRVVLLLLSVGMLVYTEMARGAASSAYRPGPPSAQGVGAVSSSTAAKFNVGYQIHHFTYTPPGSTPKTVTASIWYPTQAPPVLYSYNRTLPGMVAPNSSVYKPSLSARYPLLVYSHGFWGCATASTYLTQYIASQGYIVIAPEHEDRYFCSAEGLTSTMLPLYDLTKPNIIDFPDRPIDISASIDEMLRLNQAPESAFYQAIDLNAIGVIGHSLGAWTVQVASGALPGHRDNRIKAALLLEAGVEMDPPDFYSQIHVPVMYQLGQLSRIDGESLLPRRRAYDASNPSKFLVIIEGADHMSFDDTVCQPYLPRTIENCQASSSQAATAIKYSTAFFDYSLKHENTALATLRMSPELFSYEQILKSSIFLPLVMLPNVQR